MSDTTVEFPGQARWDTLVTSAILGVDRQPPAAYLTDHPMAAWVARWADRPAATRLLREAFVLDRAMVAGQRPTTVAFSAPEPDAEGSDTSTAVGGPSSGPDAPVSTSTTSPAMLALWRRWRAMEDLEACMIWVDVAAEKGMTVPDEDLPWLWSHGERNTALRPKLAAVSGPMGAWLLQRPNHPWPFMTRYVQNQAPVVVLSDDASDDDARQGAFSNWAREDAAAAFNWLQGAWDGEKAEFRTSALRALRPHSPASRNEAWWTKRLTDRSRNVRALALDALWADPATTLAQQENAITRACFVRTPAGKWSSLFGGQGSMDLVLPPEGTKDDEKRGLDIDSGYRKIGPKAWMLHERVRRTHPDLFAQWDGLGWADRLKWAQGSDEATVLLDAWSDAAITFQNQDLARALLALSAHTARADIAAVLPLDERQALARNLLLGVSPVKGKGPQKVKDEVLGVVRTWPGIWTEELTRIVGESITWSFDRHGHLQPWGEAATLMQMGHPVAARALLDEIKSYPMAHMTTPNGEAPHQEVERYWGAAVDRRLALHNALQEVHAQC